MKIYPQNISYKILLSNYSTAHVKFDPCVHWTHMCSSSDSVQTLIWHEMGCTSVNVRVLHVSYISCTAHNPYFVCSRIVRSMQVILCHYRVWHSVGLIQCHSESIRIGIRTNTWMCAFELTVTGWWIIVTYLSIPNWFELHGYLIS